MKHSFKIILLFVTIICFLSCNGDDKSGIGPCVHTYKEPILNIMSIRDTINNINLSFVKLRELKINGQRQYGSFPNSESYSIVADDSIFYCNIPFGFVNQSGKYEFIFEAEGFEPKHFIIDSVDYSIYKGGCPSYNDGGKRINLIM